MRKPLHILLIGMMVVSLSACTQTDKPNIQGKEEIQDTLKGITPDFVLGTDDEPDGSFGKAYTEDGYYSFQFVDDLEKNLSGQLLTYTEYGSSQSLFVCGKAGCNHENPECNAYFDRNTYPPVTPNYIWYYDGNLYVFCVKKDYYEIEKVAKDGSSRSKSCNLFRTSIETETDDEGAVSTGISYPKVVLHRGYVYFSIGDETSEECCLYRVKLDSTKEAEKLYIQDGKYPALYRLKGYGNYILFQMGNYLDKSLNGVDMDICAWDIKDEKVVEVVEGVARDYTVGTDCIYYFDLNQSGGIMKYDLKTKETTAIGDIKEDVAFDTVFLFERDGKLYASTENSQLVFDQSGTQIYVREGNEMIYPYVPSLKEDE